ncbi:MAG: DUF3892 domain-containing protein [Nitrosopumilaceae archaeon]
MDELKINCVKQDLNGVITHVGIEGKLYEVQLIVDWINFGIHGFYTLKDGKKAKVYASQQGPSGRWFLTTHPDDTRENNLDFLPIYDDVNI